MAKSKENKPGDKLQKMKSFLVDVNKKYNSKYGGDVMYIGNDVENFNPFPTGFPTFDWINSGIGGFPRGGMTLIHGLESTGKSTFVLSAIHHAMSIDPNITVLYIDVENSMTKDFLKFRNIDPARFMLSPLNTEDALQTAEDAIKNDVFDLICIDSLAKMESDKMLEKDLGDSGQRNRRAVIITEFFRRITFILRKSNTALICINQEIDNQDRKTPYDPPTVLPCGKQQKYSANLRIELKRSKAIKQGEKKVGYLVSATSAKNKISGKEKAMTYLTYLYDKGFIREYSLVDYLNMIGYIEKKTMGRYEFVKKELYPNTFKPSDILKIVEQIKNDIGIDLYDIRPSDDIQFEINEEFKDVGTKDEIKHEESTQLEE
jgi:protein RecA